MFIYQVGGPKADIIFLGWGSGTANYPYLIDVRILCYKYL